MFLKWRNPEPYVRPFWGWIFPYISLTYSLFRFPEIFGFLHFRYLKCLVNVGAMIGGKKHPTKREQRLNLDMAFLVGSVLGDNVLLKG